MCDLVSTYCSDAGVVHGYLHPQMIRRSLLAKPTHPHMSQFRLPHAPGELADITDTSQLGTRK